MEKQINQQQSAVTHAARTQQIVELLNRLEQTKNQRFLAEAAANEAVHKFWGTHPELKKEYDVAVDALNDAITSSSLQFAELEEQIKSETLKQCMTIKNGPVQAVYSSGRTTWDSKRLEGYATANPEINAFKKVSPPSVSIRWSKNDNE